MYQIPERQGTGCRAALDILVNFRGISAMKLRIRMWMRVISLLALAAVLHFSYTFITLSFEHQRANRRFSSYRNLLIEFNVLNLINDQYDPSDQYERSFEGMDAGNFVMAQLTRKAADGTPLYSWRFAEYLTWQVPLPHDLPWSAEEYQYARELDLFMFCQEGTVETFVFAMAGPDTAFDSNNRPLVKNLPEDLILFADVYQSNTHWMQPGDFNVETLPDQINVPGGLGSENYRGFMVSFVDGQIWWLEDETPVELVKRFCTITGARKADRSLLEPYCRGIVQSHREDLDWLPKEAPTEPLETPTEARETQVVATGC